MPSRYSLWRFFNPWQAGAVLVALVIQLGSTGYLAVGFVLELFTADEASRFQVLTLLGITALGLIWLIVTIVNFQRRKRAARASAMFWQLLFVAIGLGATSGDQPNLVVAIGLLAPASLAFFLLIGKTLASEFEGPGYQD